jgi:uncharacterized membrane protein YoaK (UPF0700 family)
MIYNEEVIFYLSETYKVELYKSLMLAGCAGFLGGILNCSVQKYFTQTVGDQTTNLKKLAIQYIANGVFYSLGAVIFVYSLFRSDLIESKQSTNLVSPLQFFILQCL